MSNIRHTNIYSKDPADRILKMIWSRDRIRISHAGGESRDRIWNNYRNLRKPIKIMNISYANTVFL